MLQVNLVKSPEPKGLRGLSCCTYIRDIWLLDIICIYLPGRPPKIACVFSLISFMSTTIRIRIKNQVVYCICSKAKVISDAWGVGYPWAYKVPGHEPGLVLTATPAMCVSCMSCISLINAQAECLTVQAAHLCFHTQAINEDFAIRLTANSQLFLKIELFSLSKSRITK